MKYIENIVEAIQWFEMGDHPKVRHYVFKAGRICQACKENYNFHGRIKIKLYNEDWGIFFPRDKLVCPGDWIVKDRRKNSLYTVYHPIEFKKAGFKKAGFEQIEEVAK